MDDFDAFEKKVARMQIAVLIASFVIILGTLGTIATIAYFIIQAIKGA